MSRRKTSLSIILLASWLAMAPSTLAGISAATDHPMIKAWFDAWSIGTSDGSFLTDDVAYQDPFQSTSDRQGYLDVIKTGLAAFRDVELTADDLILDGDRGALTWTVNATHNNSGRAIRLQGVSILRFRGDKIAAEWRVYDSASLLRQIGALPDGGADGDGGD